MKRCHIVLFAVILSLDISVSSAQNAIPHSGSVRSIVTFLSPKNGDRYVPAKTTLLLHLAQNNSVTPSDLSFTVVGEQSGIHSGNVILSDEGRAVIFKPDVPFLLNEMVSVKIIFLRAENITPIAYSFRITEMAEQERDQVLSEIRQSERGENRTPQRNFTLNNDPGMFYFPDNDTTPCYIHVDTLTNPASGNIFFSAVNFFGGSFSFIGMLDNSGKLRFNQNIPRGCENFKALPDNTFSYFAQTPTSKNIDEGIIYRIDGKGNILGTYQCGNGYTTDYHDFDLLPNGHAIVLSFDPEYVDMTKIISDTAAKSHAKVTGAIIQEIDKDKNVIFQWRSWDHLNITDATHENFTSSSIDYVHMNTATVDTDGNIIASFRHMDEVDKISRTDTNMIWRWGGKHNQFTFIGDTLTFSHQHNPTRIANGHITLWDNGNFRYKDTIINGKDTIINRPFSRAIEFDLDETHHTATSVWQYRNVPVSAAGGNVQRLANGNTFMDFGIQTTPNMMEITPQGEKVFQLSLEFGAWCYRAYKFPLAMSDVKNTPGNHSLAITNIFPNPAQNIATISYTGNQGLVEISLTDILGHTVRSMNQALSQTGVNNFNINIGDLPNGMYYCKLSQNGSTVNKTLIVQK